MQTVSVMFRDNTTESHLIDGSFRHCQGVIYSTYGRLNIRRIRFFVCGQWIDSPYGVNPMEAYNAATTTS
ncbi:MAG: hypothetical protein V3V68_04980 [Nitrosomonadaceae bacterium]